MSAKKKLLIKKFRDYQKGRLSEAETEVINEWFDAKPEEGQIEPDHNLNTARLQQELFANIQLAIKPPAGNAWYRTIWFNAACLILVISVVSLFMTKSPADLKGEQTTWQIYSTSKAEVKQIVLADGTSVWMNAGTKIRLNSDFNTSKSRRLKLDYGEAFFKVKRDTLRPFSIATGRLVTTVLGTSFNIRSYPEMNAYKITVATGKVKVAHLENGKIEMLSSGLVRDQALTYDLNKKQTRISNQDASLVSNWKTNRSLYFDNLTLSQIGAELSRQYNIPVKVTGPEKREKTYTMHFQHHDLRVVLQQLVSKTGINYQLTNKKLILNPGP
ncbi:MAG: FecR domain-containing protein [Bacteroidota bacterium]